MASADDASDCGANAPVCSSPVEHKHGADIDCHASDSAKGNADGLSDEIGQRVGGGQANEVADVSPRECESTEALMPLRGQESPVEESMSSHVGRAQNEAEDISCEEFNGNTEQGQPTLTGIDCDIGDELRENSANSGGAVGSIMENVVRSEANESETAAAQGEAKEHQGLSSCASHNSFEIVRNMRGFTFSDNGTDDHSHGEATEVPPVNGGVEDIIDNANLINSHHSSGTDCDEDTVSDVDISNHPCAGLLDGIAPANIPGPPVGAVATKDVPGSLKDSANEIPKLISPCSDEDSRVRDQGGSSYATYTKQLGRNTNNMNKDHCDEIWQGDRGGDGLLLELKSSSFSGQKAVPAHRNFRTIHSFGPCLDDSIRPTFGASLLTDMQKNTSDPYCPNHIGSGSANGKQGQQCVSTLHSESDILTEGMAYFSMVMFVNIYGKLREMSILGNVSVKLTDIDVNSHQYFARKKEMKRRGLLKADAAHFYLDNTRTSQFVVQAALEESEMLESSSDFSGPRHHKADDMGYDTSLLQDLRSFPVDQDRKKASAGCVLASLMNGGFEVVWFSDRHPKEIIYGIVIDKSTCTVTVVLHGQESAMDRLKNSVSMEQPNPIAHEVYEGSADTMFLRAAVSEELLRPRRDTGLSTIDEIHLKVQKIGKELANGGDYNLSVAGHSLGAGLATVCGFYLAANPNLQLASAVRVYTYTPSGVGCKAFQQSFKRLEDTGRLKHASFTKSNEFSLFPLWSHISKICSDDWYKPVGMQICLDVVNAEALDISYHQNAGLLEDICRVITHRLRGTGHNSCIPGYQRLMHSAKEYRSKKFRQEGRVDGLGKRMKCLPSLDDLYGVKDQYGSSDVGQKSYSVLTYILVSFLVSLEIALLLRMVLR
jgi:hypothetical protein